MSDQTAADVAREFGCSAWKVRKEAARLGLGYNLGGRAGYRFTPVDVDKLRAALAPQPAPVRRRTA